MSLISLIKGAMQSAKIVLPKVIKNPRVQKWLLTLTGASASGVLVHKIDKSIAAKQQEMQNEQFKEALRKEQAVIQDLSSRADASEARNDRLLQVNEDLNNQLEKARRTKCESKDDENIDKDQEGDNEK